MNLIFTCGGTAGHINPAIAVANMMKERHTYLLNHPYQGLFVDRGIWRTLDDFSSGAVCLVLAEDEFDESDYIYDYHEYEEHVQCLR